MKRNRLVIIKRYVFNSIEEINRLRKEISRLLSKGMSNIDLKVTFQRFSKLPFSGFKKLPDQFSRSFNADIIEF